MQSKSLTDNKVHISKVPEVSNSLKNSKSYNLFLSWLCQPEKDRKIKTIIELAKNIGVSREMIYRYSRHPYTKYVQDQYYEHRTAIDRDRMYNNVINLAEKNPRSQRLYFERYENWQGIKPPTSNIQVNIYLDKQENKPEDAEHEVIEDNDKNEDE